MFGLTQTKRNVEPTRAGSSTEDDLLVHLLARTDSLWMPCRVPLDFGVWSEVYRRRREYVADGLRLPADESAATRKKQERAVSSLVERGLLEISRAKYARVSAMKLTHEGDLFTRSLCNVPGMTDALCLLHELHHRQPDLLDGNRSWHDERRLCRIAPGRDELVAEDRAKIHALEEIAVCALTRQWVEALSDTRGRVFYSLTATGMDVVEGRTEVPAVEGPPRPLKESHRAYDKLLAKELRAIQNATAKGGRGIGACPLPVGRTARSVTTVVPSTVQAVV